MRPGRQTHNDNATMKAAFHCCRAFIFLTLCHIVLHCAEAYLDCLRDFVENCWKFKFYSLWRSRVNVESRKSEPLS